MPTPLLALLALPALPQDVPKMWLLKDAKVVVRPGTVLEHASILIKDGKIAAVGDVPAPQGAEVIDCAGLTAYAGLIHPFLRTSIAGVSSAAPAGAPGQRPAQSASDLAAAQKKRDADPFNREGNLLAKPTKDLKQADVSAFESLAKSGYTLAQVSATGGLLGTAGAVYGLGTKNIDPSGVVSTPDFVPISLAGRGGFGGGYPSSTMGVIAFIRQSLFDAQRYNRLAEKPKDAELATLAPAATGKTSVVFDDLNEVSFFQAANLTKEFGLQPVYVFRSDAGAVMDLLKNGTVMLKGAIPPKPSVGSNLETASLRGVRTYFNELQAAVELEKNGIPFVYAPADTSSPLEGIRMYVRGGLGRDAALAALTTRPASLLGLKDAGTLEQGNLGNVVLTQGDILDSKSQIMATFVQGKRVDFKMPDRAKEITADGIVTVMKPNYGLFPLPAETT
ncbi:MAG TPA: hypothetical protein VK934_05595, partial [Fimbriimonas sp.]|nr:hypothetical protein [Fimbriimonas sp.]